MNEMAKGATTVAGDVTCPHTTAAGRIQPDDIMDRIADLARTIESRLDRIDILEFDDDLNKPDADCSGERKDLARLIRHRERAK